MPNGEERTVLIAVGIALLLFWLVFKLIFTAIDRDLANMILNNGLLIAGAVLFFQGTIMRND
ncbi:MAG: hypothetical protein E3J52_10400 [Promethearchaeota archaeon]|nr:MAG: hypothetical protein E3J52_10400 [Candidatus Lokiarchaeota archaeon]